VSRRYTPRPWQPVITTGILRGKRVNLLAPMGSGKSAATLEAISVLLLFGEVQRVLIVAPKRVALYTWPESLATFGLSFGHMRMAVAVGDAEQRHAAVRSGAHITTINFENLEWLVDFYGPTWPFDMVVVDESTKLRGLRVSIQTSKTGKKWLAGSGESGKPGDKKGQGASRARALARVAHTRVNRWVNLTGTFVLSGLEAAWGQTWFLDTGHRLGNSFSAFSKRWFYAKPGSDATRQMIEPLPFAQEQIMNAIRDVTVVVDMKDYLDIAEPLVNHIYVDLPPSAQRQYKEMARDLLTEIQDTTIEALAAGAKSQKLLQIASGSVYTGNEKEWVLAHDEKIEALKSVIEEAAGMPVLVANWFKPDSERIKKVFGKQALDLSKNADLEAAKRGEGLVWIAHPLSLGHGVDGLQKHSCVVCFFSTNWFAEDDTQLIERVGPMRQMQAGFDRVVTVHRIIARGTVEESAVKRLTTKVSVQEALIEGLRNTA
jgi:hypothetical protein